MGAQATRRRKPPFAGHTLQLVSAAILKPESGPDHAVARRPNRGLPATAVSDDVSKLALWVSRKPQRKYRGRRAIAGGFDPPHLAGEFNPRIRLLVEAEDLHGG